MGIKNLTPLIRKYAPKAITPTTIDKYKNKILGIDFNLLIYKLIFAIRKHGYDIRNNNKIVTHIHSLLLKLKAFRKYSIVPVFVFDTAFPKIKNITLEKRKDAKERMIEKYKYDKTKEGKRKYYYMKTYVTCQEIEDCRELIKIFGYPIVDALEEADAQLAHMWKKKQIHYIVSDDMDIPLFGGGILIKNFTICPNKTMEEINLKKMLKGLDFTMDQLIEMGILLGSDYCDNRTVSINKAYRLISTYKSVDRIPKDMYEKVDCREAIKYFKQPVIEDVVLKRSRFNRDKLKIFLKKHGFKDKYMYKKVEK